MLHPPSVASPYHCDSDDYSLLSWPHLLSQNNGV